MKKRLLKLLDENKISIVMFVVGVVFTIIIFTVSSGYYEGDKLSRHLEQLISTDIRKNHDIKIYDTEVELMKYEYIDVYSDNVIIQSGYYKTNKKEDWNGRYIALFERKPQSFFDNIVGRPSGYFLKESYYFDEVESKYSLIPLEIDVFDYNKDGINEVEIVFKNVFADRESIGSVFLMKFDDEWTFQSLPDFRSSLNLFNINPKEIPSMHYDSFKSIDEKSSIVTISDSGDYWIGHYDGNIEVFTKLSIETEGQSFMGDLDSIYMSFIIQEDGMVPEPNWNNKIPMIVPSNEKQDFDVIYKAGQEAQITGGIRFYSAPSLGNINQ